MVTQHFDHVAKIKPFLFINGAEILTICSRSMICVPDLITVVFYVSSRMCQYLMFPNDAAAKILTKTTLLQVTVIRGWCSCHVNGLFSLNDIIWMFGCLILKTCNQSVSAKSTFLQESWTTQLHLFFLPPPPFLCRLPSDLLFVTYTRYHGNYALTAKRHWHRCGIQFWLTEQNDYIPVDARAEWCLGWILNVNCTD